MSKFIITINYGYGDQSSVEEASSQGEADELAYMLWREAVENQSDYAAYPWTETLAYDLDLEEE
jgi:hypothetical protein